MILKVILNFFFFPLSFCLNYFLKKKKYLFLYISGFAIGDNICATSVIASIHKKNSHKIFLYSNVPEVYKFNLKIFKNSNINKSYIIYLMFKLCEGSNIIQLKTKTYPYKNLHDYIKNNNEKCKHLIEYIGGSFFIKQKLKIHKNEIFFSEKELKYFKKKFTFFDKEYAIINPTGKNSYTFVKSWGEKKYQKLVDILKFNWVQIGYKEDFPLKGAINLNGKTALRELFFLVCFAKFVISDEGLLNHLASCFDVKSFVLMSGFTPVEHISYKNTFAISKSPQINCAPCYLVKEECYRDIKYCTEDISVENVKQNIIHNL